VCTTAQSVGNGGVRNSLDSDPQHEQDRCAVTEKLPVVDANCTRLWRCLLLNKQAARNGMYPIKLSTRGRLTDMTETKQSEETIT